MIPAPFYLRGFPGNDPLDNLASRVRLALVILITGVVSAVLVYVISDVFPLIDFHGWRMKLAEIAGFGLIVPLIVLPIRRSSSLVITLLITLPLYALDLFLQSHYRDHGRPALWDYLPGTFIMAIEPPALRFLVTLSFDGLVIGPLCLWLSRLAALLWRRSPADDGSSEPLFPPEWTDEAIPRPPRNAPFWVLRLLGFAYLLYLGVLLLGAFGASPWPLPVRFLIEMTYGNPYLAVNTVGKVSLMIVLASVAAFNYRFRWVTTLGLCLGHVTSVVGSVFFYFLDPPGPYRDFLLASAIVDAVMVALFIWILMRSVGDREQPALEIQPDLFSLPTTLWRVSSAGLALLAVLHLVGSLVLRLTGHGPRSLVALVQEPDPTLCNSLTLDVTVGLIAVLMLANRQLRDMFTTVLGRVLIPAVLFGLVLLAAGPVVVHHADGSVTPIQIWFAVHLLVMAAIATLFLSIRSVFFNVEYTITSFRASSALAIVGLHDALFEEAGRADVLQAIDRYAGTIRGRKQGLLNFPFWSIEQVWPPLFGLRPPFSTMSSQEQKYFVRYSLIRPEPDRRRSFVPELADIAHDLGIAAHSVVLFAVYAGRLAHSRIGYVPPGARRRFQDVNPGPPPDADAAALPRDQYDPLNWLSGSPSGTRVVAPRVSTPIGEPVPPTEVDYLVVGSGAGGSVMAYRLACEAPGARIAVIERGGRFSPRDDVSDYELDMISKLYKEGGLQQTKRADMTILQGECVGGGSVVNNAVCYRMPDHIRQLWAAEYGLTLDGLDEEYDRIAAEIEIGPLSPRGINRSVEHKFRTAVTEFNANGGNLSDVSPVQVNGPDARGDGLWNLGNKYFGKRTVLETYIPWSEARGVQYVPNVTAVDFAVTKRRVESASVQTIGGHTQRIRIRKALIICAGVIASSQMLIRSRIAAPAGVGMSCNLAMPVALEFDENLDAFDGEQITLGAMDQGNRAIFETYFNPPGALSLMIPFFFDRHRSTMDSYRRLVMFGALIGSESNGLVETRPDFVLGQTFSWTLGSRDTDNIRFALDVLVKLGLYAGAKRAIMPTQPGVDLPLSQATIDEFRQRLARRPLRMRDLAMSSAHPQGGNAMIGDGSGRIADRVVDQRYRVVGCDNVFVADASVFPTSITVNPQWTIMATSSLAAASVLEA
jgi:hypothetical protein